VYIHDKLIRHYGAYDIQQKYERGINMSIRNLFTSDLNSESLSSAILRHSVHTAREERKMKCKICGNVHIGLGAETLCPVCKRPGASSYIAV
jgi:rubrerythrin